MGIEQAGFIREERDWLRHSRCNPSVVLTLETEDLHVIVVNDFNIDS